MSRFSSPSAFAYRPIFSHPRVVAGRRRGHPQGQDAKKRKKVRLVEEKGPSRGSMGSKEPDRKRGVGTQRKVLSGLRGIRLTLQITGEPREQRVCSRGSKRISEALEGFLFAIERLEYGK
jgi:hypothetical protein